MRRYLFLLFFFASILLKAQTTNYTMSVASHSFHSTILKEERFFDIYTPADIKSAKIKPAEIIYVLDGAAHFTTVIELLKQLAKETRDSSFSRKIVVGIGNIWARDKDYTPTHVMYSSFIDSNAAKVSGGGEQFISFLKKELIPYVDSIFPVAAKRILIGHSLGGLMVVHTLFKHTALFNKYAAIDPSMWWDDQRLLKQAKIQLANKKFENSSLFLGVANTSSKDMLDAAAIRKNTSRKTALNRPSVLLADYINANAKLSFEWKYYKNLDHMSVFRSAVYDGLKFLLKP